MINESALIALVGPLRTAAVQAADGIVARDTNSSFLERVLRDALAGRLASARTEQPLDLDLALWPGRLGGVDLLYVSEDKSRIGVETKVWDVADSLYDLVKLAAATQRGTIDAGFCVIAGRIRDWTPASAIRDVSVAPPGTEVAREVVTLLRNDRHGWAHIWSRAAIRPTAIPARIRTITGEPVLMPQVPDHEIRLIGVQAIGPDQLRLDPDGSPV